MYQSTASDIALSKPQLYHDIETQFRGLLRDERHGLANAANFSALLFDRLPNLNWAGFYFLDLQASELIVGPFQGKPACVRISIGRGVCGTAVAEGRSIVVPDVHAFPGHIACDAASRSEIVVPLWRNGAIVGVLDLDSPLPERFDETDREALERLVAVLIEGSDPV